MGCIRRDFVHAGRLVLPSRLREPGSSRPASLFRSHPRLSWTALGVLAITHVTVVRPSGKFLAIETEEYFMFTF